MRKTHDREEEPTCGKGLAENASLPAKLEGPQSLQKLIDLEQELMAIGVIICRK